ASGFTLLPTPDSTGTIVMAATAGKVALVNSTVALSGACPTTNVMDMVGYGSTATCFEASPAPAPGNNTSDVRAQSGCQDANNNLTDFSTLTPPNPRNTQTSAAPCSCSTS